MSNEVRVPPGVTFDFERLAVAICEEAKLDYEQWAPQVHELVTHLQERWREGVEQGLNTDDAESRALELFGSKTQVARSLRASWIRRFLTFQRYRGQRYAMFLCAAVVCAYVTVGMQVHANQANYAVGSVGFFYLLGTSLNGAVALGALALVKWRPQVRSKVLAVLLACRWVVAPLILTGLFNVLIMGAVLWPREIARAVLGAPDPYMLVLLSIAGSFGLIGAAGYVSELVEVPNRRSKRLKKILLAAHG
jgi:hypothetical protein